MPSSPPDNGTAPLWQRPVAPADHPDVVLMTPKEIGGTVARVLQAVQWPTGAVGVGSDAVAFRQTMFGDGLSLLWKTRSRLSDRSSGQYDVVAEGEGWTRVVGQSASVLLAGPNCADLACADVRSSGLGTVTLTDAVDTSYLPQFATNAARRGIVCLVTYRSGTRDAALLGGKPGGWFLAVPTSQGWTMVMDDAVLAAGHGTLLTTGSDTIDEDDRLSEDYAEARASWRGGLVGHDGEEPAWDVIASLVTEGVAVSDGDDNGSVAFLCISPGDGWTDDHGDRLLKTCAPGATTMTSADFKLRYWKEHEQGVEVAWDVWWDLLDFGDKTLVITSEQSRLDTGGIDPKLHSLE